MIRTIFLALLCMLLAGTEPESPSHNTGQNPKIFNKKIKKRMNMEYLIYVPKGYVKDKEKYPLILFLHSTAQKGNDLEMVRNCGLPKILETRDDFPFIVVSPQCPVTEILGWNTEILIHLLDDILSEYRVDESRIFLTGMSMGGRGTWSLAIEHPERFAAIAPVCGYGIPFQTGGLKGMPVWVFHGAKDPTVPVQNSYDMVDALKRNGAEVKHTVYHESGHDVWTLAYNDPELYEWFLAHKR